MNVVHVSIPPPKPCSRCEGEMVLSVVFNRVGALRARPSDQTFFDLRESELDAYTCGSCGLTELYAQQPEFFQPRALEE